MMTVTVSAWKNPVGSERAEILTMEDGTQFIAVRPWDDFTLGLYGRDAECVAHARALAACLTTAADELEAAIANRATNTRVASPQQGTTLAEAWAAQDDIQNADRAPF